MKINITFNADSGTINKMLLLSMEDTTEDAIKRVKATEEYDMGLESLRDGFTGKKVDELKHMLTFLAISQMLKK